MHILVCDDDAAFSAKVAEYAATYFEAHEIPVQATVCADPEQVLAIPDLEYRPIWPLRWMATRSTPTATSSNGTSPSSCPAVWRTSMRP